MKAIEIKTGVFYRRSARSPLEDPVLATVLIATVVTVCIAAVASLFVIVCWNRYKKRYFGEWIVNTDKGKKVPAACLGYHTRPLRPWTKFFLGGGGSQLDTERNVAKNVLPQKR